jgi:hypothetical protein
MFYKFVCAAFLSGLLLTSCTNKDQGSASERSAREKPRAVVVMRDGTQVEGTVVDSSGTEIKIAGDDRITRTIPTIQVKSINYGDAPAEPASAQTEAPAGPKPLAGSKRLTPSRTVAPSTPDIVHESHQHPSESAITTTTYELPVGTQVPVRTEETIDSGKAVEGQTFPGEVTEDVLDATGATVIPRGATAQLIITSASKGGRFRGASDLGLDLKSVTVDGREYRPSTTDVQQRGKSGLGANKRTAEYSGGGAALGAIIGAIAGGGKSAGIGAGAGAGAGALTQVLTKGGSIRVPVETILTFSLDKPLHVVAAR